MKAEHHTNTDDNMPANGRDSKRKRRDPTHQSQSLLHRKFCYTDGLHSQFKEQGFITIENFLSRASIHRLRAAVDEVYRLKDSEVHDEWVLGLHQMLPETNNWMLDLATEPRLLDMIEKHLGPNLVLFSTQLATKRPNSGCFVPWHQDGERCRTVWIPLDDIDETVGGLHMLPGAYKLGRLKLRKVKTKQDIDRFVFFDGYCLYESDLGNDIDVAPVFCKMQAGALECHHPATPHCSYPNNSLHRWRRAIILRYQPSTEPLETGSLKHWRTQERIQKANYLVRGNHEDVKNHKQSSNDGNAPKIIDVTNYKQI